MTCSPRSVGRPGVRRRAPPQLGLRSLACLPPASSAAGLTGRERSLLADVGQGDAGAIAKDRTSRRRVRPIRTQKTRCSTGVVLGRRPARYPFEAGIAGSGAHVVAAAICWIPTRSAGLLRLAHFPGLPRPSTPRLLGGRTDLRPQWEWSRPGCPRGVRGGARHGLEDRGPRRHAPSISWCGADHMRGPPSLLRGHVGTTRSSPAIRSSQATILPHYHAVVGGPERPPPSVMRSRAKLTRASEISSGGVV